MLKRFFFLKPSSKKYFSQFLASSLLMMMVSGCACSDNRKPEAGNKKDQSIAALGGEVLQKQRVVRKAIVNIKSLPGHQITGRVIFTKVPGGIKVVADVDGLKPGKHGFHVHEFGDCGGKEGAAAGAHFNPTNSRHGGPDSPERHVGDLGNLEADGRGHAHYERVDKLISFEGQNSILERSIMIHADPDDYTTQPTGASGGRIACGIIEAVVED